jgi:hypothetical protein
VTFGIFPKIQRALPDVKALSFLGAGFGAIALGRNPNGWTSDVGPNLQKAREKVRDARAQTATEVEVVPSA